MMELIAWAFKVGKGTNSASEFQARLVEANPALAERFFNIKLDDLLKTLSLKDVIAIAALTE